MADDDKKPCDLQANLRQMMQTTKKSDLERALQKMMQTTRSNDLQNAFRKMIHVTRSLDQQIEEQQKAHEKNLADAFQKMIRVTHSLEHDSENELVQYEHAEPSPTVDEQKKSASPERKLDKVKKKVPRRIRSFPAAFRRNPKAVIKYFLGLVLGRVLAIVLYVLMALIPALPIPDAVANMSKPPAIFGTAFNSMRTFFTDLSPQTIIATVTNIPTDINKILQKIGEFFTYYAKRAGAFLVRAIRHPKLAFRDVRRTIRQKMPLVIRLARGAFSVLFSFLLIKLAMIFLLPLFGGIALTVLGIKVSIILFVVARMIADKVGELIGKYVFNGSIKCVNIAKTIREAQVVKAVGDYLKEWLNQATNKK